MKSGTITAHELPAEFSRSSIYGATVEFTKGPFGCFFTQEITGSGNGAHAGPDWVAGWLDFVIKEPITLYPVTSLPLAALYCGMKGTIPCSLQGPEPVELKLEQGKFSLYYVPPALLNTARFSEKHYEAVYFSISTAYLARFQAAHTQFGEIYKKKHEWEMQGERVEPLDLNPDDLRNISILRKCRYEGKALELFYQAYIDLLLVSFYTKLANRANLPVSKTHQYQEAIQKVIHFIELDPFRKISIRKLAKLAGMNLTTFEQQFKANTHFTPSGYILDIKLTRGEHLVSTTSQPISEIAHDLGFSDVAHFSNKFKEKYKLSPLQYRKKGQGTL